MGKFTEVLKVKINHDLKIYDCKMSVTVINTSFNKFWFDKIEYQTHCASQNFIVLKKKDSYLNILSLPGHLRNLIGQSGWLLIEKVYLLAVKIEFLITQWVLSSFFFRLRLFMEPNNNDNDSNFLF